MCQPNVLYVLDYPVIIIIIRILTLVQVINVIVLLYVREHAKVKVICTMIVCCERDFQEVPTVNCV
jgi:hypothetical protein